MRTKVVFSGMGLLLMAVAAIGFVASRDREVSANVYYYCWECADMADAGLGCLQVQYTSPEHGSTACPEGTFANEGLCSLACTTPSSAAASSAEASSDQSSSVESSTGGGAASSSQSSQLILVITGIEEPPIYLLTAAGIIRHPAFLLIAAAVAGLATYLLVRRK